MTWLLYSVCKEVNRPSLTPMPSIGQLAQMWAYTVISLYYVYHFGMSITVYHSLSQYISEGSVYLRGLSLHDMKLDDVVLSNVTSKELHPEQMCHYKGTTD